MVGLIWFLVGMVVGIGSMFLIAGIYSVGVKEGKKNSAGPSNNNSEVK